jgi:ADP-ribose pyrophosphatase YjhB (NUDIX family)
MINCQFENSSQASLRHVTVDVLVIKDGQILLGKRSKKILEAGKWGLLGGFVDRDETLQEAVKREVMEESGYQVQNIKLLTIRDNPERPHDDRQNIYFVFLSEATDKITNHDWEIEDLQWFAFDEIPEKEKIAFDHSENIDLYLRVLDEKLDLPVIN